MCGIAGHSLIPGSTPPVGWLNSAQSALHHRGPDGSDVFEDPSNGIGLVHSRLAIIDLSPSGHQPMFSDDKRVALVFNGEIYNFRQLRAELELNGHIFVGNSDTEVLLNLYLEQRRNSDKSLNVDLASVLRRINGIFSFALWDSDRSNLLLGRDAFGVKPLYFMNDINGFYFSSEIKVLPAISFTLDVPSLDRYLSFLWSPGEGTPATEVRKLGPGEVMLVAKGNILEHFRWYQLPVFKRPLITLPSLSEAEAIRGTEHFLREAVHHQLVSDVPVGAFLSGGLDSSSIVAFARELNPKIQTFSIEVSGNSDEGFSDDLPYAHRVAKHLGVSLEVVKVDAHTIASCVEEMVWQLDEPLADLAPLNARFICHLARQQGIKVLLSGAGGDDLFTGYRRHIAVRSEPLWSWLPRPFRIYLRQLTNYLPTSHPFLRRLRKAFSGAHLDGDARLVHHFRWIERPDLHALYTPAFQEALGFARAEDPMMNFLTELPREIKPLERMLALEQRFFLTDHNLNYTDKMSMAVGVEVRVPFLDLNLVDFASRIPARYKQRGKEGKWVLKKAMQPYLPRDIIYRPKSGFGVPLRSWLKNELRDWLANILSTESLSKRGLFEPQAVHFLVNENFEGRIDASYTLLSLASIEIWCRHFIDRASLITSSTNQH